MKKIHEVDKLIFTDDEMIITVDGTTRRFTLAKLSPRLASASTLERERFEVSPSGYGIHWPLLDEDLSVDGLLGISHAPLLCRKQAA